MNRDDMLKKLQAEDDYDIVIIGGGATGLGAAVDASSRGYKTLLVEQFDFGKATSSRATKLVHGGVRYLAQGNIKLVREALKERSLLLKNAPHITSKLAFVIPVYSLFSKVYYGIGLKVYDMLSGKLSLGSTKWLSKKKTLAMLPGIKADKLFGGILYFDGQFDDARLAIDLAATAAQNNATLLNYCHADGFIKTNGKITGISVTDNLSATTYIKKAKVVINATGVFVDRIMQLDEPGKDKHVAPSQGIHLVTYKEFFPSSNALMIPKTEDGRVLFAVPWHDKIIIGTTDTPVDHITEEPIPLEKEIEFVLHHANLYFSKKLERKDITSMFAGLRPLVKTKGTNQTSILSRDHTIMVSPSNLVTITGGKWTTYRKMAEDVVTNAAFVASLPKLKCKTETLKIHAPKTEVSKEVSVAEQIHAHVELVPYFIKQEMAQTPEDILARRTRLLFTNAAAAIQAAPAIANAMASVLDKDRDWAELQTKNFIEIANHYLLKN